MHIDEGGNTLVSYGGRRVAFFPGPGVPAAPVLVAAALSSKPVSSATFLGAGLAAGTYAYFFSYVVDEMEYAAGAEATVVWAGPGVGEVRIAIPNLPAGVTDLNLYGRAAGVEVLLQRFVTKGVQGQYLLGTFLDQGQALDGQASVPANTMFKKGGGRLHRLHVPGTGGVLGNLTVKDAAGGDGAGGRGVVYGPTAATAGAITDVQAPVPTGLWVQAANAGTVFAVTYS